MTIWKPAVPMQYDGSVLSLQQLELSLGAISAATLRELLHVLTAPSDVPRLNVVLESVCDAVASYGSTLKVTDIETQPAPPGRMLSHRLLGSRS